MSGLQISSAASQVDARITKSAVPEKFARVEIALGSFAVRLFDKTCQLVTSRSVTQWRALLDIAVAGFRAIRGYAERNGHSFSSQSGRPHDGFAETVAVRDHVIGRHDDQHRIRIAAGRPQGRQRQRRRGIASERLENDRGPLAEQANLFGNDKAMLFIANDQRFKKSGNPSTRATVACSMDCSPTSGSNCLGYFSREIGHRRVPEPPERTTGRNSKVASQVENEGWPNLLPLADEG